MCGRPWTTCLFFLVMSTAIASASELTWTDYFCANERNYTANSVFARDLLGLLPTLFSNMDDYGFYAASTSQVHALALCRADVQHAACQVCVRAMVNDLLIRCANKMQAIRWDENCIVRYSDQTTTSDDNFGYFPLCNPTNVPNPVEFRKDRDALLDQLWTQAAAGGSRLKAAGSTTAGPANITIYSMVQCVPTLSTQQCYDCLLGFNKLMPIRFNDTVGLKFFRANCITYFEITPSYNYTRLNALGLIQRPPSPPPPPPPPPPPSQSQSQSQSQGGTNVSPRNITIIVVPISVSLALTIIVVVWTRRRRKLRKSNGNYDYETGEEITFESTQYDFDKIRAATNDFSDDNKLGRGGFGIVYKGILENGREIAVKRLSQNSGQGDLEFKTEVLLVARLQHRNLVRLLGSSMEANERLLVYEFVQNGSLDQFIFDPTKRSMLNWAQRYNIIEGIVKGLLYLHEDSRLRVIHRDLKASNILLNEDMSPKIADFGMATLVAADQTAERSNRIVGTYGYMAPEYAFHGQFSVKSDVFSFGVLVLEIISGQRRTTFQHEQQNQEDFLSYVWRCWRNGTIADIMDPVVESTCRNQLETVRCLHISLLCVQENVADRPTMAVVAMMLNNISASLPTPSKPAFYIRSSTDSSQNPTSDGSGASQFLSIKQVHSNNDVTMTEMEPR